MELRCLPVAPLDANCFLLKGDTAPEGLIVDPGGEPGRIIAECAAMGMTPAAVLLTHGHFDHVGGVPGLLDKWPGLPIYLHPADDRDAEREGFPLSGQLKDKPGWPGFRPLEDDMDLTLAGLPIHILHTPGHTPGSVTIQCGSALFTGDTLFRGSMGRTDFPGGSNADMMVSLRRLSSLEGDYKVYPGHMDFSTLDFERRTNPYLREALR